MTPETEDAIRAMLDTPAARMQRMTEERAVRQLGDAIGYGRMMQLAERLWAEVLVREQGLPNGGGALSVGPCVGSLVPCPCPASGRDENGHCDWCCGAGRVTKRVREAMLSTTRRGAK